MPVETVGELLMSALALPLTLLKFPQIFCFIFFYVDATFNHPEIANKKYSSLRLYTIQEVKVRNRRSSFSCTSMTRKLL